MRAPLLALACLLAAGCESSPVHGPRATPDGHALATQDVAATASIETPPPPTAPGPTLHAVLADGRAWTPAEAPPDRIRLQRVEDSALPLSGQLLAGEAVETSIDTAALLQLPGQGRIYLGPQAEIALEPGVLLRRGRVFADVTGTTRVRTATVSVDAQGGPAAVAIEAGAEGRSTVTVLVGTVRMGSVNAAWPSRLLGTGERGVSEDRGAPRVDRLPRDELVRERERLAGLQRDLRLANDAPTEAAPAVPGADAAVTTREWFVDVHALRELPDETGDIDFAIAAMEMRPGADLLVTPKNGAMLRGTPTQSSVRLRLGAQYQCITRFGADCYFSVDIENGEYVLRYGVIR